MYAIRVNCLAYLQYTNTVVSTNSCAHARFWNFDTKPYFKQKLVELVYGTENNDFLLAPAVVGTHKVNKYCSFQTVKGHPYPENKLFDYLLSLVFRL